ncbi:MAG TPA: hypothetical protein VLM85_20375 [Polyangiaceae bacterium]|nr:hypothetical protein [Polyangiaceae bacterium]
MTKLIFACGICLALVACADVPARSPAVASVDGAAHVTIRAEAGHLWWSHRPWTEPHALWSLPGQGPVENLVVTESVSSDGAFVVRFEQGGTPYVGRFAVDGTATLDTPASSLHADRDGVGGMALESELAHSGR